MSDSGSKARESEVFDKHGILMAKRDMEDEKMLKRICALVLCAVLLACNALADGGAIVAQIGERKITRAELDAAYAVSYGDYAAGDEELEFDLRLELLGRMLQEEAERIMQEHLGFDQPTQAEIDAVTALAEAEYHNMVDYYAVMFDDGTMTDDELHAMAAAYLESMDMSLADYTGQAIAALADEKLRAWALEDLEIGEEQIRAVYESMVEDDRAMYEAYPDDLISCALYGIPYLYVPEGMREIRQIVIGFDADQMTEYGFLADVALQGGDAQADLDALYGQLDGRVGEVMAQLDAGKPFEDVELEYSDLWALTEPGMEQPRYFVCEGAGVWDPVFTQAAMALETVGQISGPVRMSDGVHILCYWRDVPPGPVAYEEAADYVAENASYQAEGEAYSAAVEKWMEELGAQIYLDELD